MVYDHIMLFPRRCAGKALFQQLLRHTLRSAPVQQTSFAFSSVRTVSSSTRAGPVRVTIPDVASMKLSPRPNLSPQQVRAAHHADKLYQAGKTALFRAPSHFAYLLGSWVLAVGCISSAVYTYWLGHWKTEEGSDLPFFVPVANALTLLTIGSLGSWILMRSTNLVTAIDLVKTAGGCKMRVSVRRAVPAPFVPHRQLIIAPYDLHLPTNVIRPATVPQFAQMPQEDNRSRPLRFGTWAAKRISFTLWSFFAGQRKIFTHEGFLIAGIEGQNAGLKIDLEGTFPNGVWNLVDISTLGAE